MHIGALTTEQLTRWAMDQGASPESARQLARHLVGRFAGRDPDTKPSHRLLSRAAEIRDDIPQIEANPAADGTVRYAVHFADGALVEAVAIPHPRRTTICLSTQAGCARGCLFCETGRLGLTRNLSAEEITGQFAAVSRTLAIKPTNIVFMGMGEPLDNLDAVLTACDVLSDDCGFATAPRRITISTVGVVPKMLELNRRSRVRLAVSLHAANDAERQALLPVARSWNLDALRDAITQVRDSVLIQWTLIAGVNDSDRHVDELRAFCDGLDVRVNLIPLNPGPEELLRAPDMERVRTFQKRLRDSGIRTLVRMPHGQEIGGACGQLAGSLRERPDHKPRLPVLGRARAS